MRAINKLQLRQNASRCLLYLFAFVILAADGSAVSAQLNPRFDFFSKNDIIYYDDTQDACIVRAGGTGTPTSTVANDFTLGPINDAEGRQVALMQALIADYDLSPAQAAGIVGNFMHESGGKNLPPNVNERTRNSPGGTGPPMFSGGYGWAQWTGPRQRSFINFAVENGYMASQNVSATDAANYAYLRHELDSSAYANTLTELRKQNSPEDAAISFEATFERAGVPAISARTSAAKEAYDTFVGGSGATTIGTGGGCGAAVGSAGIVGDVAFPLLGTKSVVKNPGMFHNGTADKGGHPYTAYDILADPGAQVAAFMSGVVKRISSDRCPGRLISIYNEEADLTVSYLHLSMNNHVQLGATVRAGERIGVVGSAANGCGVPHLHIDAAKGTSRPGCSRLSCPSANASRFVDIGPQLYLTYQELPK